MRVQFKSRFYSRAGTNYAFSVLTYFYTTGFERLKDLWLEKYESEDFTDLVEKVWKEEVSIGDRQVSLEIFYKQLHAYVRKKLKAFYSDQVSVWF